MGVFVFDFKQKTAYEMRISDWISDVCSSDLHEDAVVGAHFLGHRVAERLADGEFDHRGAFGDRGVVGARGRSEEHTSELQSLMRISYAVFCLKKKHKKEPNRTTEMYKCNDNNINTIVR